MKWITTTAVMLLLTDSAFALKASDYDANDDDVISPAEQAAFAIDSHSVPLSSLDSNGNGEIDGSEFGDVAQALERAKAAAENDISVFAIDYPNGQAIAAFALDNNTEDKQDFQRTVALDRLPIKVRASHESITHGDPATVASKASPAEISFTRDSKADNEVLVLKGAVMWPIQPAKMPSLLVVPSISVNKVSNDNSDADVDSLVFRVGFDWEGSGPGNSLLYWRLLPTWTSDTDLELDVRGLEAQVEPVGWLPGMGNTRWVFKQRLGLRWRAILHGEYGRVEDNAGNSDLVVGETFARLGPKIETSFWFASLERLALGIDYEYLPEIGGDLRDRKLFRSTLSYNIDQNGHFRLQSKYTNGDTSAALEDEESWTIGLGVKF